MTFSEAIEEIVRLKSNEVLTDDMLFMAMFSDLAPDLTKEKKIMRRICEDKMLSRFYLLVTASPSGRLSRANAIRLDLKDELGFSDEWTAVVMSAFFTAFHFSDPEKENSDIVAGVISNANTNKALHSSGPSKETNSQHSTIGQRKANKRFGITGIGAALVALASGGNKHDLHSDEDSSLIQNKVEPNIGSWANVYGKIMAATKIKGVNLLTSSDSERQRVIDEYIRIANSSGNRSQFSGESFAIYFDTHTSVRVECKTNRSGEKPGVYLQAQNPTKFPDCYYPDNFPIRMGEKKKDIFNELGITDDMLKKLPYECEGGQITSGRFSDGSFGVLMFFTNTGSCVYLYFPQSGVLEGIAFIKEF